MSEFRSKVSPLQQKCLKVLIKMFLVSGYFMIRPSSSQIQPLSREFVCVCVFCGADLFEYTAYFPCLRYLGISTYRSLFTAGVYPLQN